MGWCARRATAIREGKSLGFTPTPADVRRMLKRTVKTPCSVKGLRGHCWEWQGPLDGQGYGSIQMNGKRRYVHRVGFASAKGDKKLDGMQVDHLCRNRCCWNPRHLRAITHGQNAREANERRWAAYHAAKAAQRARDDEPPHHPTPSSYGRAAISVAIGGGRR